MLRSVVLLLVIVATIWWVGQFFNEESATPVRTVDYSGQLSAARDLARYDVLAPAGLDAGWRATSVELQETGRSVQWHLGFLTPEDEYVGLEQFDGDADVLTDQHLDGLQRAGSTRIAGEKWAVFTGAGSDQALLRTHDGVLTVVVGTAGLDQLEQFAAALVAS